MNKRLIVLMVLAAQAFNNGDYAKARSLSQEAVRLEPEFAEAWVMRGMSCALAGDETCARESYERALLLHTQRYRANPGDANQLLQRVHVLLLLGRETEARSFLAQGLTDHPADQQLALFSSGLNDLLADGEYQKWALQQ